MKSFKRLVVFMLVLSMVIGTMVPAFAFSDVEDTNYEDEINKLAAVGVVNGDEDGSFRPEDSITRAEVAAIICKMLNAGDRMDDLKNQPSKFSDVEVGAWYTGAINLATGNEIINGYPDGTFKPDANVKVSEAVTMLVNALGHGVYVKESGEWPANFIIKAAELGVTKNVATGSQEGLANRGMVAAMAWNALDVPTWNVTETSKAGDILSGYSDTMLVKYFKDFVTESKYEDEDGNLKWAEDITVDETYLTDKTLASGQIKVNYGDVVDQIPGFEAKSKNRVKDDTKMSYVIKVETATEVNDKVNSIYNDELVVYVEDTNVSVAELLNKKVDIMFGKDNNATLVVVRDEAENDMLTKYLADDNKIVVGSEEYKLADTVKMSINNVAVKSTNAKTVIEKVLTEVGAEINTKAITKAIKVNITLNDNDKVEKIGFIVSGNFVFAGMDVDGNDIVVNQLIVKEIDDEEIVAVKESTDSEDIDMEELKEADDLITVLKDGEEVELSDIAAGDVITYTGDIEDATVMYVSSAKVTGTADRIKKSFEMTIDGTSYYANKGLIGDLSKDIEDAEDFYNEAALNDVVGEEVELYLNFLGEYVAVLAETEGGDYTFGIVKKIVDASTDVEEYEAVELRIVNENGDSKIYNIIGDDEDVDLKDIKVLDGSNIATADALVEAFVAFKVTGENNIKAEDMIVINDEKADFENIDGDDYSVAYGAGKANYDDEEITVTVAGEEVVKEYTDETVIFNIGGTAEDKMEIVKAGFKAIVAENDSTIVVADTIVVYDDNDDIKYIVLTGDEKYVSTESDYAYVVEMEMVEDDAYSVKLYVEGEEKVYETKGDVAKMKFDEGDFVKYEVTGAGKLDIDPAKTFKVIDVQAISTLKVDADLAGKYLSTAADLKLDASAIAYELTKKHITVDEVTTTTVKFDKVDDEKVANIKFERDDDEFDGIIYDLRDIDAPAMVTDIAELEGKAVFAFNADKADADADLFVIVKR